MNSYRWIPWAFAGALGCVVVVNGALAYFALTSSTGLVTEHPYDSGSNYNRVLDAAAAQDALGWRGTLRFTAGDGEIAAEFTDGAGKPLSGLAVAARLVRPVEPLPDVVLALHERAPGRYVGSIAASRPGQWEVRTTARRDGERFEFAQRIVVK
jgi:nitrogen fixation protein FixH